MSDERRMSNESATADVRGTSKERVIRAYIPADRDRFLSLYETVWGREKGEEWFEWRFEDNPLSDGVHMIVAEEGGELVGAEPLVPYRLRVDETTLTTYQPVDWIVHPDYRRRGLFTAMTESLLERYATEADLLFNFPSGVLRPGLEKFDWEIVGTVPTSYRIQNPRRVAEGIASEDSVAERVLVSLAGTATKRWLDLLDRMRSVDEVTVDRHTGVLTDVLTALYESDRPRQFHVPRDEAFLEWTGSNPLWETTTYVASRHGDPVASVVTVTEGRDDLTCTELVDVQPMATGDAREDALTALLATIVSDHEHADILTAPTCLSSRLRRRFGFWSDTTFPLSRVTTTSTLAVRPLGPDVRTNGTRNGGVWEFAGLDAGDQGNWRLQLADLDTE